PSSVSLDNQSLAEGDAWSYDVERHFVIIRTRQYTDGKYLVEFPSSS
ncbi:MAG: hypothetical protein IT364_26795, partial [Candidatus Hydrogenedentes bacterium]|nr:hypothetical protein [Candidatus Hydrogenedentota bacterium]